MKSKLFHTQYVGAVLLFSFSAFAPLSSHAATLNLNETGEPSFPIAPGGEGFINGAFITTDATKGGTGVLDPFLTVQANGTEQGYNQLNNNFDTKKVGQFTKLIQLQNLVKVTISGIQYYEFNIDVNENNNTPRVSLDSLDVYTSASPNETSTSVDGSGRFNGSLGTQRYTMGANNVLYDDTNSGSGVTDIVVFIPVSDFVGALPTDYVYMYQAWGYTTNTLSDQTTDGGFEETFDLAIPEASTFLPLVAMLLGVVGMDRMRRRMSAPTLAVS
jgi:hypothetical protein